jgi:DNA-binding MarR family transcriptional regulator
VRIGPADYWTLAELRYHIRRFLRIREEAARAVGLEPQQYLLLLQAKGLGIRRPVTLGALAERLQLRHHSTVELVDRLARRRMVRRRRDAGDRRTVLVELAPAGEAVLRRLAAHSLKELRREAPALVSALRRLMGGGGGRPARGDGRSRGPGARGRRRR